MPPTAVQRQPESAPPQTEEDRNWRRLETIMQRHKERQAAEEETETTADASTNIPSSPAASAAPIAPSFAKPPAGPKPAPGIVSRQPSAPPREAPMVAVARGRGERAKDAETAVPTPPADPDANLSASADLEKEPDDLDFPVAAADETMLTSAPPAEMESTDKMAVTAEPLEAVWPVKTVEPEVQRQETMLPPSTSAQPLPSPDAPPMRPPTPQDAWVHERLSAVPPGMPTDSSVPLLRPRRPRPGRGEQAETSVIAAPIQAKIDDTAVAAEPLSAPPIIQRQPEQVEATAGLVPTEIGDLPPDLWTLIGQPTPAGPSTQPQAADVGKTVMAKREGEGTTAALATAPLPFPEMSRLATPDPSEYIQREAVEEEAESRTQTTDAPLVQGGEGGAEAEEKKEAEEVDINELARQVYAHIRGQLAVEKERERGRLKPNW